MRLCDRTLEGAAAAVWRPRRDALMVRPVAVSGAGQRTVDQRRCERLCSRAAPPIRCCELNRFKEREHGGGMPAGLGTEGRWGQGQMRASEGEGGVPRERGSQRAHLLAAALPISCRPVMTAASSPSSLQFTFTRPRKCSAPAFPASCGRGPEQGEKTEVRTYSQACVGGQQPVLA